MTSNDNSLSGVRINGRRVEPSTPWTVTVTEPATGGVLAELAGGAQTEAVAAIEAAASALPEWADRPANQRAGALRRIAAELRAEATVAEIGELISRETGKRIAEARAEVGLSAGFFEWFADAVSGANAAWSVAPGLRHDVIQRPLGVVAVLTPWNFPVSIPARKIAPALAAGCSILFKPSEVAPSSAMRLAEIVEAQLPPGALNTVIGAPETVSEVWLADRRVRGLTFTGSTRVGRLLAAATAPRFTRNVLELGGSAPFVVLDDADLDRAVELLMIAKYRNNGQSCIAANQVWVPKPRVEAFAEAFAKATDGLQLGDPMDESTTLGPLALPSDDARIEELVADAQRHGAEVVRASVEAPASGQFTRPAICVEPGDASRMRTEEIFGPAVPVFGYTDPDEVLKTVREGEYGLGGYVIGEAGSATQFAAKLDVGIVGVNTGSPNTPQIPFGGLKDSGIGSEGGYAGLDEFRTNQTIAVAGH